MVIISLSMLNYRICLPLLIILLISLISINGTAMSETNETGTNNNSHLGFWLFGGLCCVVPISLLLVNIGISIWMYKDAEKKKESGAVWLIIGLLFPFLGCLIWFIVRPPEPSFYESKAQERDEKPRRSCPECGREIPLDANTCPYCSKKFESDPALG